MLQPRVPTGGTVTRGFLTHHPGQDGRHFIHDIFRCIFVNEKSCMLIKI